MCDVFACSLLSLSIPSFFTLTANGWRVNSCESGPAQGFFLLVSYYFCYLLGVGAWLSVKHPETVWRKCFTDYNQFNPSDNVKVGVFFIHAGFYSTEQSPLQSNPVQSNRVQSNPLQSNPVQSIWLTLILLWVSSRYNLTSFFNRFLFIFGSLFVLRQWMFGLEKFFKGQNGTTPDCIGKSAPSHSQSHSSSCWPRLTSGFV